MQSGSQHVCNLQIFNTYTSGGSKQYEAIGGEIKEIQHLVKEQLCAKMQTNIAIVDALFLLWQSLAAHKAHEGGGVGGRRTEGSADIGNGSKEARLVAPD